MPDLSENERPSYTFHPGSYPEASSGTWIRTRSAAYISPVSRKVMGTLISMSSLGGGGKLHFMMASRAFLSSMDAPEDCTSRISAAFP